MLKATLQERHLLQLQTPSNCVIGAPSTAELKQEVSRPRVQKRDIEGEDGDRSGVPRGTCDEICGREDEARNAARTRHGVKNCI